MTTVDVGLSLSVAFLFNEAMPSVQLLLFPDPQPLVERLGRDFFRRLPECPGVYLMRDRGDGVLYVGKAKNLRKRLGNYRVANPQRFPRRHLRLLRAVARIEIQELPDEDSALAREAELLRTLKPRFNRVGTWFGPPRFLAWRVSGDALEMVITLGVDAAWQQFGPLGSGAAVLRMALARLLWLTMHPSDGLAAMPEGWLRSRFAGGVILRARAGVTAPTVEITTRLVSLFDGQADTFCDWVRERTASRQHPFERAVLEADIEFVEFCFAARTDHG
jgi:predicted GIY-YIG superfamily endonuclease